MELAMAVAVKIWGVAEVAAATGMKKSWVYAHAESGEIPSFRLPGGRLRFDPKDIADWIERLKKGPARLLKLRSEK